MIRRTKLTDRVLPHYTCGEECMNMVTHIIGAAIALAALVLCIVKAAKYGGVWDVVGAGIFGTSMILLYTISSIYHGLRPIMGKKVLQVLDHCAIYVLIAGTYTPVAVSALWAANAAVAWCVLGAEWLLAALAVTLTAIDLRKYRHFSMVCYIALGWGILPFLRLVWETMQPGGFWMLLFGGIAYTAGAVFYGIGAHRKWLHSVFHVFVLIGSVLHILAVLLYALPG